MDSDNNFEEQDINSNISYKPITEKYDPYLGTINNAQLVVSQGLYLNIDLIDIYKNHNLEMVVPEEYFVRPNYQLLSSIELQEIFENDIYLSAKILKLTSGKEFNLIVLYVFYMNIKGNFTMFIVARFDFFDEALNIELTSILNADHKMSFIIGFVENPADMHHIYPDKSMTTSYPSVVFKCVLSIGPLDESVHNFSKSAIFNKSYTSLIKYTLKEIARVEEPKVRGIIPMLDLPVPYILKVADKFRTTLDEETDEMFVEEINKSNLTFQIFKRNQIDDSSSLLPKKDKKKRGNKRSLSVSLIR